MTFVAEVGRRRLTEVVLLSLLALFAPSALQFLDNGRIRLGVDLGKGGSIVYLAKSGGPNLINSADLGRQIQMSFYSGPVPFAPNGKQPAKEWAGLGWNPIQTGDFYNHPSKISNFRNDGKTLYLKCVPMQWPLDNEAGRVPLSRLGYGSTETRFEVRNRLVNTRSDTTQFPARGQKLRPSIPTRRGIGC